MTKAELIDDVSHAVDMSRKDSEIIVETIFESIVKSLRTGDKIEIRGFGSFPPDGPRRRPERRRGTGAGGIVTDPLRAAYAQPCLICTGLPAGMFLPYTP